MSRGILRPDHHEVHHLRVKCAMRVALLFVFVFLSLAGSAACPGPCADELLAEGQRLRVTIVEIWDKSSRFVFPETVDYQTDQRCNGFDGLGPGSVLELKVVGQVDLGKSCNVWLATLEKAPGSVALTSGYISVFTGRGSFVESRYEVMVSGCEGLWGMTLARGGGSREARTIFEESTPGRSPVVIMYRSYSMKTGTCPRCDDYFVVRLEKR